MTNWLDSIEKRVELHVHDDGVMTYGSRFSDPGNSGLKKEILYEAHYFRHNSSGKYQDVSRFEAEIMVAQNEKRDGWVYNKMRDLSGGENRTLEA